MKLLTKEIIKKLPPLYSQENNPDPLVVVKFFDPFSQWTWYAIEYDPKERIFFGFVVGFEEEMGYFSLDELESIGRIERDEYWKPVRLSLVKAGKVR